MDDRRFDSLVKAWAEGKSRRSVLKGLLGLGGTAAVGSTVLASGSEAARRPTPTPTQVRCPGKQTAQGGQCVCKVPPAPGPAKCGPDCCNPAGVGSAHSECCDQACCFGTCYGEELCCKTNTRTGGALPLQRICDTVSGPECCAFDDECCSVDGCCSGGCFGGADGISFCCSRENFCPGSPIGEGQCCSAGERCCDGGTDNNSCRECCFDNDCPEGVCQNGACVCLGLGEHCTETQDCCQDDGETTCRDTIQCNAPQDTICCRPVGSVCGDNCDCCGTIPCEGGQCCLGNGMGVCNGDSSNCCAGLTCVGEPGDDSCRRADPPCAKVGEQCGPGVDCCFVDLCTSVSCQSGTCVAQPVDCDDENACTNDWCDLEIGCAHEPVNCNDNNACTVDSCDPEFGCRHVEIVCNDNNACTIDSCDPDLGCVFVAVSCNDNNACTIDSCDPDLGCVYTPIDCDDNNPCTIDSCDAETGCVYTPGSC